MQFATITKGGKVVALLIHDPQVGRVVFKGKAQDLHKGFELAVSRSMVTTWTEGHTTRRRKVLPTEDVYLHHLADRVVGPPYVVNLHDSSTSSRLDDYADTLEKEYL